MSNARRRERIEVTGRDSLVMAKAVAYAIATIQSLPDEFQEASDCEDMVAILRASCSDTATLERIAKNVERHCGVRPILDGRASAGGPRYDD